MHALSAILLFTSIAAPSLPSRPEAGGVVFDDQNRNGKRDPGEPGVPGVGVSNGIDVVQTDDSGRYELAVGDEGVVFVIKPAGWQVPLAPRTNLPQHYYLHRPDGSPKLRYPGVAPTGPLPASIDFPLTKVDEPRSFRVLVFGDTQPRNQREVDYTSHDVVEEVVGFDATFGMTLGDLVFDDLTALEPIASSVGCIGIPWHHVIGNHDVNMDATQQRYVDDTYERIFGPSTYSFNVADAHFIVMNDVMWEIGEKGYHAELGSERLSFIESDLARVPESKLVVLAMHIPLVEIKDRAKLFTLLARFPHTLSLAAHWHAQQHFFIDTPGPDGLREHHHVVHATACGAWWSGEPDEQSLPHTTMTDGGPNGYTVLSIDGTRYSMRFQAARRPAHYQMNVYAPEVISRAEAAATEIVANVFFGSSRCKAEMRLGTTGEWRPMERFEGKDPGFLTMKARQRRFAEQIGEERGVENVDDRYVGQVYRDFASVLGRAMPRPGDTGHLWRARLPEKPDAGYHVIYVRATDQFGAVHEGRRIIRIE